MIEPADQLQVIAEMFDAVESIAEQAPSWVGWTLAGGVGLIGMILWQVFDVDKKFRRLARRKLPDMETLREAVAVLQRAAPDREVSVTVTFHNQSGVLNSGPDPQPGQATGARQTIKCAPSP